MAPWFASAWRRHLAVTAIGLVAALGTDLWAQQPKPKPKPKPSERVQKPKPEVDPIGTVLVVSDAPCRVSIDGEPLATLNADEARRFQLREGRHLIVATALDGSVRWDAAVDIKKGQQEVVAVRLSERIAGHVPAAPLKLPGGARLAEVTGGTFQMGCAAADRSCDSDESPRQVSLSRSFWLMTTEVTVMQYREFAAETRRPVPTLPRWISQNHPIVNVTWAEAAAFCTWMGGRLPTEAEWERASRTADERRSAAEPFSGNSKHPLPDGRDRWDYTAPVGSFPAVAEKFFDLAGNVWEWTADWYERQSPATAVVDPKGPPSGMLRAVRGGAWTSLPHVLRSSERDGLAPNLRYDDVGFRCAADRPQ